ncbi:unnamed protein product [Arctia plantaginis]|uniref:Uncharacterized protein n=1 Tax=Arctia plantaginis TaxID=874455 RepID=A0A8S1BNM9_ARCPL|nr:unnamed protein product [Arctia plantaginis]
MVGFRQNPTLKKPAKILSYTLRQPQIVMRKDDDLNMGTADLVLSYNKVLKAVQRLLKEVTGNGLHVSGDYGFLWNEDLVKIKHWRKRKDRYGPHIYVEANLIFSDTAVSSHRNLDN